MPLLSALDVPCFGMIYDDYLRRGGDCTLEMPVEPSELAGANLFFYKPLGLAGTVFPP